MCSETLILLRKQKANDIGRRDRQPMSADMNYKDDLHKFHFDLSTNQGFSALGVTTVTSLNSLQEMVDGMRKRISTQRDQTHLIHKKSEVCYFAVEIL